MEGLELAATTQKLLHQIYIIYTYEYINLVCVEKKMKQNCTFTETICLGTRILYNNIGKEK